MAMTDLVKGRILGHAEEKIPDGGFVGYATDTAIVMIGVALSDYVGDQIKKRWKEGSGSYAAALFVVGFVIRRVFAGKRWAILLAAGLIAGDYDNVMAALHDTAQPDPGKVAAAKKALGARAQALMTPDLIAGASGLLVNKLTAEGLVEAQHDATVRAAIEKHLTATITELTNA